jgi:hypothetical protein
LRSPSCLAARAITPVSRPRSVTRVLAAAFISAVIAVIADSTPARSFLTTSQQALIDVQQSMKAPKP